EIVAPPAPVETPIVNPPLPAYAEIVAPAAAPEAATAPAAPVEVASALAPAAPPVIIGSIAPQAPAPEVASLAPPAPVSTPLPSAPQFAVQPPRATDTEKHEWWAQLPAGSSIRISNGAGRNRMAARFAYYLGDHGLSVARIANAPSFQYRQTIIFYNPDQK